MISVALLLNPGLGLAPAELAMAKFSLAIKAIDKYIAQWMDKNVSNKQKVGPTIYPNYRPYHLQQLLGRSTGQRLSGR